MIVCKKCGNQNPDDATFCTSCRAFLEWAGEKVVEPPPPAPPPTPAPEPETHFVDRVKQAVGLDQPRVETPPAAPTPPSAPPAAAPVTPAVVQAPAAASVAPAPTAPAPAPTAPAVLSRAPEVPAARIPQAVAPAPERPRQAPKMDTATGQRYKPGDVICGQCGAGNDPERHFCQRCGANLAQAAVVKTPWYRKLFPARTAPAAGTRPKGAPVERAWGAALFRIVALGAVALLVLVYLVVPPLHNRVNTTVSSAYAAFHQRFFAGPPLHVEPSSATASSQLATHPARLSVDLIKETYWAANVATDKQPWLRLTFGGPVDFDQMLLTTGAANDYASFARPKDVQIIMSDKSSVRLTLKDDPNPQSYDLVGKQVTYVEIHILSVYPTAQSTDVAINEVEFVKFT